MNIPEGWQLVPVDLTEEMNVAGIFAASQMIGAIGLEQLNKKRKEIYRAQLATAPTPPAREVIDLPRTPASLWRINGEPDPHSKQYDCERAALCLGTLTDDELANAVFLYGNEKPDIQAVLRNEAHMPLTYLTAAKDRIRWLSRKLEGKPAPEVEPVANGHTEWRDAMFDASVKREKRSGLTAECFTGECHHTHGETKVATTPDNDGLRKAAEEIIKIWDGKGRSDMYGHAVEKLRAELNKDKS